MITVLYLPIHSKSLDLPHSTTKVLFAMITVVSKKRRHFRNAIREHHTNN